MANLEDKFRKIKEKKKPEDIEKEKKEIAVFAFRVGGIAAFISAVIFGPKILKDISKETTKEITKPKNIPTTTYNSQTNKKDTIYISKKIDVNKFYKEADRKIRQGDTLEAKTKLEIILQIDNKYHPAMYRLSNIYENKKQFSEAINYVKRALAIAPNNNFYKKEKQRLVKEKNNFYNQKRIAEENRRKKEEKKTEQKIAKRKEENKQRNIITPKKEKNIVSITVPNNKNKHKKDVQVPNKNNNYKENIVVKDNNDRHKRDMTVPKNNNNIAKKETYKKPEERKEVVKQPKKIYKVTGLALAQEYFNDNLYNKSIPVLENLLKKNSNNANAHRLLAETYEKIANQKRSKNKTANFEEQQYIKEYNIAAIIDGIKQEFRDAKNAYDKEEYQDAWYISESIQTTIMNSPKYRKYNWRGKNDLEKMVNTLYQISKNMDDAKREQFRNKGRTRGGFNKGRTIKFETRKDPKTGANFTNNGEDKFTPTVSSYNNTITYAKENLYKNPTVVWKTLDKYYDDNDENAEFLNLIGRAKLLSNITNINKMIRAYKG